MRRPIHALVLLAVAGLGCDPPQDYRAETELRPDGTVARTVQQQNLEGTEGDWDGSRPAAVTAADDWATPLAATPGGGPTTVAWGEFADALAVPPALPTDVGRPLPLTRDPATVDRGLLTVFTWSETVQPGAQLVRLDDARRDLVRLIAADIGAFLEEALPPGTDAAPLVAELTVRGDAFTVDAFRLACDTWAEMESDTTAAAEVDAYRLIAILLRNHGLDLLDDGGRFLPREESDRRLQDFFTALVVGNVRQADGSPVDAAAIEALLDRENSAGAGKAAAKEEIERLQNASVVRRHGSVAARDAKYTAVYTDLIEGLLVFARNRRSFAYRQTMPGVLLDTNGRVLSGGAGGPAEVLFQFASHDTFPDGREMRATSALVDPGFQRRLFGGVPVRTREEIAAFLALLDEPGAAHVWNRCLRENSVDPLRAASGEAADALRSLLLGGGGGAASGGG